MKTVTLFLLFLAGIFAACTNPEAAEHEAEAAAYAAKADSVKNVIVEAWNTNNQELLNSVTVENVKRNYNGTTEVNNQAEYGNYMKGFISAFPDFNVVVNKTIIAHEDMASINYWTVTGTNTGEFNGAPPTGKKITVKGLSVWYINADGMATQEDVFVNDMSTMQQLGYTLSPPAMEGDGEAESEAEGE